jgi:Ca-activated chloride channel family protein
LRSLPPLAEDASEEEMTQYVNYIYSLFKVDYESPDALLEALEIVNADNPESMVSPEIQKEQYNVIIALDASGSMGNTIGGKTMMEIAKEAISEYVESLPEDANVGLRVYGHEGTGSDSDKSLSCGSNELIYDLGPFNKGGFNSALQPIQPAGWTPLAEALLQSGEDLKQFSQDNSRNIIYFVSDGIETCDGNPVEAAKKVAASGVSPVVNIIGFGVNEEESKQLKDIADAAQGTYANAKSQAQLREEFSRSTEEATKWQAWHTNSKLEIGQNYTTNSLGIMGWENRWLLSNPEPYLFIQTAITNLSNFKLITYDQMYWMQELPREKRKTQEKYVRDLGNKLLEVNRDNYNTMMNEVNEIYKSRKNN